MAHDVDPFKVSSPRIFLVRMLVFLILCGLIVVIIHQQIWVAFMANPPLNALIIGVLMIGIALSFRQVIRLFPEVAWVNGFRLADPGIAVERSPVLLAPMATILGDRIGRMSMSSQTMRSILDSIAIRLDEAREISRYMTGLLIFLGLLGTFWGLLETVSSVSDAIRALDVTAAQSGTVFEDLKTGLEGPLKGMGLSFSSSLFGLAGSLILGFLDLKASQAQNRFYNDLEDWLSTITDIAAGGGAQAAASPYLRLDLQNLQRGLDKIGGALEGVKGGNGAAPGDRQAIEQLADAVAGLVQQMREEQKMVRQWAQSQQVQQNEIQRLLIRATGQAPARGRARVEDEE